MNTPSTDRQRPPRSPQSHNLRIFLVSQIASQAGTWVQFVALAWLAGELTGSATALAWVAVALFGPLLVLGPWTGALADRVDKHRLLIAAHLLVVGQAAALGTLVLAGVASLTWVYGLTLTYGLLHAVEAPVRRAFLAEVVDEERIAHAVSLTGTIAGGGRILGPLLAGGLIASAGIGWCFIVHAISYVVALIALLALNRRALHIPLRSRETGAVRAGLRYAWSVPELRIALLLTGVVATFGFNHQVLVPVLANFTFNGGVAAYTLLYSAMSVGSVLGALLVGRRREIDLRFLVWAISSFAVSNFLVAISPNLVLAAVAAFATGAAALLFITASATLLQQRCAPAMRGRVMALSAMVLLGGVPVGAPLVGWIADLAGPRTAVAVGSVAALLAVAVVLPRFGARVGEPGRGCPMADTNRRSPMNYGSGPPSCDRNNVTVTN